MRARAVPLISAMVLFTAPCNGQDAGREIMLPDLLAVELPSGKNQVGPDEYPMRELLAAARSGTRAVTADLQRKVGPGPLRVTWTAWEGLPRLGKPVASRTARVIVLPFGMTPAGLSGDENATAGNSAVHIARDSAGFVHMVWADSGRPGAKTGPVYRRAVVERNNVVRFETALTYIAEDTPGDWNSYPALAVSGQTVQLVWQGNGTVHTRRLVRTVSGWVFGSVIDTRAKSDGRDVGPAVGLDATGRAHVVTPDGIYAHSDMHGENWTFESIPLPPNERIKTASITVELSGAVDFAFSSVVSRPNPPGKKLGGYWQLRTITHTASGNWVNPTDVLASAPGWAEASSSDDVLADWVRIAADQTGGLHLAWHGTVNSRKFGNDTAFYSWRRLGGQWQTPAQLVPQDPAQGIKFSFAPSLALHGDEALPLVFFDVYDGPNWIGFDSSFAVFRNGRREGALYPLTRFTRDSISTNRPEMALSARFPAAAPVIWHAPDGRLWLDVLELLKTGFEPMGPNLLVYHRVDVTRFLHG